MGISFDHIDYLNEALFRYGRVVWEGMKMLELGNQRFYSDGKWGISGKEFFAALGVSHVSIDLNGQDGAIEHDLREEISGIGEPFDIVTNFGTSEHIDGNQYQVFKTMHDLLIPDGFFVMICPNEKYKRGHGVYYYKEYFFRELSKSNNYHIEVLRGVGPGWRRNLFVAKKRGPDKFMSREKFEFMTGIERSE